MWNGGWQWRLSLLLVHQIEANRGEAAATTTGLEIEQHRRIWRALARSSGGGVGSSRLVARVLARSSGGGVGSSRSRDLGRSSLRISPVTIPCHEKGFQTSNQQVATLLETIEMSNCP
nr:hypothetical protein Iba_chr15aCG3250 [Ipomoea batatas]